MSHWLIFVQTPIPGIVLDVVFGKNRVDNPRDEIDVAVRVLARSRRSSRAGNRDMGTVGALPGLRSLVPMPPPTACLPSCAHRAARRW